MCPAMSRPGALDKLLGLPGSKVVYLGWNGLLRSYVSEELYEYYKVTPKSFQGAQATREQLDARGLKYTALPIEGQWRVTYPKAELLDSVVTNLDDYGAVPDLDHLNSYLEKFRQPDGQYLEVTDYKIQMILWQNK
jgi:hypothetical protein